MSKQEYKFKYTAELIDYKGSKINTYLIGDGPTKIFALPAYPTSGLFYLWVFNHYDLSKVQIITFDVPGWIGYSDNIFSEVDFSFDEACNIAQAVFDHYGRPCRNLLGFSFGTAVAMRLNALMPKQFDNITLVSPIFSNRVAQDYIYTYGIKAIRRARLGTLYKLELNQYIESLGQYFRTVGAPDSYMDFINAMKLRADEKVLLDSADVILNIDLLPDVEMLKEKKLMVVNSRNEPYIFRRHAEYLRRRFDHEQNIYLEGDHNNFMVNPNPKYIKQIVDFMR